MQKRKILIYIALSYGITWAFWLPLLLNYQLKTQLPLIPWQFYLASFGPLLGAVFSLLLCEGTQD